MPRLSKIGAAALAAFGWSSGTSGVTASYLVVAGGGGGGYGVNSTNNGGGGGAGGLQTGTTSLNPALTYTVTVGAGGSGGQDPSTNGSNSQFGALTASVGGGRGGSDSIYAPGASGGSAGGAGNNTTATGTATAGQGNVGGNGGTASAYGGGGGGGAGAAGSNGSSSVGGAGGIGVASSITGTSTYYAGGGGGAASSGYTAGAGGNGGGGSGSSTNGVSGTASTGGGGGGAGSGGSNYSGGNGGSGIVIISYAGAQQFGGGVVTSVGGNTIHTFTTSGTLSPITSLSASYLIVGGGGGGSFNTFTGGGAGSGGTFSGSGLTIDPNSTYLVTVGAGGAKATNNAFGEKGTAGGISSFLSYVTTAPTYPSTGNSGTSGNGYAGGTNAGNGAGGGGGASAVGGNASVGQGGSGGVGITSSISGTSTQYAGGGSGGSDTSSQTAAVYNGGIGASNAANGVDAPANYGGGGGGGRSGYFSGGYYAASNGGSGIVIISYPGSTAQMSGGTVTIVGGNVIHTFTSSGYLSPIVLLNRSLRFRSSASAYLNRTFSTPTDSTKFTFSVWVKRGALGSSQGIFQAGNTNYIQFGSADTIQFVLSNTNQLTTASVYRDPAAWGHLVVSYNNAVSPKWNFYYNSVNIGTSSASNTTFNTATAHGIANPPSGGVYFDGYMTEVNFIDGQALTPSSFGSFNAYGSWSPVRYGGSYGTNGFYLPFTNNASTTTLGYDFSPNGNNWTTNNISLTAGSTYDSMTDVPTLTSATAANFCTLNPILYNAGSVSYLDGNLKMSMSASADRYNLGTMGALTGKFYWELSPINFSSASDIAIGICKVSRVANGPWVGFGGPDTINFNTSNGWSVYGSNVGGGAGTLSSGDILGVALDMDGNNLYIYKNNVLFASKSGSIDLTVAHTLFIDTYSTGSSATLNCGQQPFTYTPPSGFVALNTYNL